MDDRKNTQAMPQINFTPALYRKLKKEWVRAVAQNKDSFTFEGHVLVRDFAKYMLQYLEMQGLNKK
jgi:hypothetical protein